MSMQYSREQTFVRSPYGPPGFGLPKTEHLKFDEKTG